VKTSFAGKEQTDVPNAKKTFLNDDSSCKRNVKTSFAGKEQTDVPNAKKLF
jgi:hypothetical protein